MRNVKDRRLPGTPDNRVAPLIDRPIALIGLPASGKSTVGRLLADRLVWSFVDLDSRIVESAGVDIPSIFATEGESGFRTRETAVLMATVADANSQSVPAHLVLATGGGIVLAEANRRMLAGTFLVVWLRLDPADAAGRVAGTGRPLLAGVDPAERLREMDRQRAGLYASVASITLDVGQLAAVDVVEKLYEDIFARYSHH